MRSDPLEGDFHALVNRLVELGDGLCVVVPANFSAFHVFSASCTASGTNAATFVHSTDELGFAITVSEERDHAGLVFLDGLLYARVDLVLVSPVVLQDERRSVHGAGHALSHAAALSPPLKALA